jgi:hypothetical protein
MAIILLLEDVGEVMVAFLILAMVIVDTAMVMIAVLASMLFKL